MCVLLRKYMLNEIVFNVYIVLKNNDKNFEYTIKCDLEIKNLV